MRATFALFAVAFTSAASFADEPPKPAPPPPVAPGILVAPAAPVALLPSGGPVLMMAKVDNGLLVTEAYKQVPVQKAVSVKKIVDGQTVEEVVTVTVFETVAEQQHRSLKSAKVTSGGKPLSDKELAEKLSETKAVVTSYGPIHEKFKGLFKDDAILIEFPQPLGKVVPAQIEPKVLPLPPKG
ncbi:MAG: hypothetical protein U0791_04710 [Gemmataceae bacterium]